MSKPPSRAKTGKLTEILNRLKRKKRIKHIIVFVVFALLLIFFATGQRGTIQLISFMKQKQDLENEIKVLETEKKQLEIEKEKIKNDPEYIEKIAREKYKMKKKDEKVYQIVEDE
jgi:cell division protein DivIC